MTKNDLYEKLHKELAEEFQTTDKAIQHIRGGVGRGLSLSEIKNLHIKAKENKQYSIQLTLNNLKHDDEVIRLISTLSESSLNDLITRELETTNKRESA